MTHGKVEELNREDVKRLAQILYLDINNSQEREAATRLVAELPSYLRRSRILSLVVDKLSLLREPSSSACFTHKPLNREIIHAVCGFIQAEVGEGLNGLVSRQTKLSIEQRRMVHNLRTVNGLWMTRTAVERKYLIRPSFTWYYQSDGCEACMISRFARDRAAITDMRTLLLSRIGRRRGRSLPPLVRWIEELMSCHGPSSLEMFVFSGEDALELKALRKDIKATPFQGYSQATDHGGLRRAGSNVTHRTSRWVSVNMRQAARRPRSLATIRRPDSKFQASNAEDDAGNEIIDYYLSRIRPDNNPDGVVERPPSLEPEIEPKLEPEPEPELGRRYKIEKADRYRPAGCGMSVRRSESLRSHMKMHSDKRSTQLNLSRSLSIPTSRLRGVCDEMSRQSAYRRGSSAKFSYSVGRPAPSGKDHCSGLTRSQTTKTSKEYAAEYQTLLGERYRVSCYSPSNYSRATLVDAPIITGSIGQGGKRPVSDATTHWSMIDGGENTDLPIQAIPPLRIRKEKRRIGKV
ncbi:hypothetical protein McaMca56_006194 [Microsporum canis]